MTRKDQQTVHPSEVTFVSRHPDKDELFAVGYPTDPIEDPNLPAHGLALLAPIPDKLVIELSTGAPRVVPRLKALIEAFAREVWTGTPPPKIVLAWAGFNQPVSNFTVHPEGRAVDIRPGSASQLTALFEALKNFESPDHGKFDWMEMKENHVHVSVAKLPNEYKYLRRLEDPVQESSGADSFENLRSRLSSGWATFISQTFKPDLAQPLIVVPGPEFAFRPIQIVPAEYQTGLRIGDVLLWTAWWNRGLSPRPLFLSEAERIFGRTTILLVSSITRHAENVEAGPPSHDTLKTALNLLGSPYSTVDEAHPRGKLLSAVLDDLAGAGKPYAGIRIDADQSLLTRFVRIPPERSLPSDSTLTRILARIAQYLGATWHWNGPQDVWLTPAATTGASPCCDEFNSALAFRTVLQAIEERAGKT